MGCKNRWAKMLASKADYLGPARIRGKLYLVSHFPGVSPAKGPADWVPGDIFRLHDPRKTLSAIDHFEGCDDQDPEAPYRRIQTQAKAPNGAKIQVWYYEWRHPTKGRPRIREFRSN
jgi:gamma-glutamylcyclotransferase (GGCT)/AIG2-like uncharacterized protein YtfP